MDEQVLDLELPEDGNTTVDRVLAIASHLTDRLSEAQIKLHIDDAIEEVPSNIDKKERAQRYLAAHYCTIDARRAVREDLVNVRYQYSTEKESLYLTDYGKEYHRMIKKFGKPTFKLFS